MQQSPMLISISQDFTTKVLDLYGMKLLRTFTGHHPMEILAMASYVYAEENHQHFVVSGGDDKIAII